jgi:hypothetical protein
MRTSPRRSGCLQRHRTIAVGEAGTTDILESTRESNVEGRTNIFDAPSPCVYAVTAPNATSLDGTGDSPASWNNRGCRGGHDRHPGLDPRGNVEGRTNTFDAPSPGVYAVSAPNADIPSTERVTSSTSVSFGQAREHERCLAKPDRRTDAAVYAGDSHKPTRDARRPLPRPSSSVPLFNDGRRGLSIGADRGAESGRRAGDAP